MARSQQDPPASVLARGILILRAFVGSNRPDLSLSDLSATTGLDKSTVLRLASVFVDYDFLSRDPDTKRYRLHTGLLEVTSAIRWTDSLVRISEPLLRELSTRTEETCSVHIKVWYDRVCIAQVESHHDLRMMSVPGRLYPVHLGSPGKALVAFLPETERREIAEALSDAHNIERLLDDLSEVRRRGYSLSSGETVPGAVGIGAPIRSASGTVLAALNVAGPVGRFDPVAVADDVLATAEAISRGLGWSHQPAG